ncbi:hypothetical protein BWI93_12980 [Siphonobacter sp. BAB-5385]|uniref:DUF3823 domain-containing protein n=1 Tax=Siphonobacter sp. BAB-5385 TaxID=1864822 RepID=UPI000B9DE16F|nr:DUF3823 domain-containing protein [Siphonobacter sp. BAB-5385]OZI07761.1 hypothetical protein BWI93_12980 [Siphonobacter sp. BAB-5385]
MKKYLLFLLLGGSLTACKFDNYDPPSAVLKGRIVYKGEPIGVEYNNVTFELWEPGWGKKGPINVTVDQNGSYASTLFDGNYKLVIPSYQGPFKSIRNAETQSDTIPVQVRGSQTLDLEVLPYYMIRNATFTGGESKVSTQFSIEKIITDASAKAIEEVALYISKTDFVDVRTNIASQVIKGADLKTMSGIQMQVTVPKLTPTQNFVFARVKLKVSGVEDPIFSPIQKVTY